MNRQLMEQKIREFGVKQTQFMDSVLMRYIPNELHANRDAMNRYMKRCRFAQVRPRIYQSDGGGTIHLHINLARVGVITFSEIMLHNLPNGGVEVKQAMEYTETVHGERYQLAPVSPSDLKPA